MKEYKLKKPIVLGEETIDVVKLDEPTVRKLRLYNVDLSREGLELAEGQYRVICACATNTTEAHIDLMTSIDMRGCFSECLSFFTLSPQETD